MAKKIDIRPTTIVGWLREHKNNGDEVVVSKSDNYASDKAKEIARLKKELKDTQDALKILKKAIGILRK